MRKEESIRKDESKEGTNNLYSAEINKWIRTHYRHGARTGAAETGHQWGCQQPRDTHTFPAATMFGIATGSSAQIIDVASQSAARGCKRCSPSISLSIPISLLSRLCYSVHYTCPTLFPVAKWLPQTTVVPYVWNEMQIVRNRVFSSTIKTASSLYRTTVWRKNEPHSVAACLFAGSAQDEFGGWLAFNGALNTIQVISRLYIVNITIW